MKSKLNSLEITQGKVKARCEACSSESELAEGFCRQCAMFICSSCMEAHQKMNKIFNDHVVVTLVDLREGKGNTDIVVKTSAEKCEVHRKSLKVYCFDCHKIICRDCTMVDHKDHKFDFASVAAPATKEELMKDLEPLRRKKDELTLATGTIQVTRQRVQEQRDAIKGKIRDSFSELISSIKQCEKGLLEETDKFIQERVDKLQLVETDVTSVAADTQKVLDYIATCVKYSSDNEIMTMHLELKDHIVKEQQKEANVQSPNIKQLGNNEKIVERSDAVLRDINEIKSQICNLAIFPVQCLVEGEGLSIAQVNVTAEVILNVNELNLVQNIDTAVVKGQFRTLRCGSLVECEVVGQPTPGKYAIQYTPINRGRHELLLSVDGQQIIGSPFPVVVSISPNQLGKPTRMWKKLDIPISVASNSAGELIVSEFDKRIVKLPKDGEKEVLLEKSSIGFKAPRSIALDRDDNIYCVDKRSCKILRYDQHGGSIKTSEPKQVKGPGYWGLAVVDDELFVCERSNVSTALVYDKNQLQYKRSIIDSSDGEFIDISADSNRNLYIAQNIPANSPYIRIFSFEGVLLKSFECSNGVLKPRNTHGVYVSGGHVYVVCDNFVFVFTMAGLFVASFGQYGSQEGEFRGPRGIFVDSDNFVVVADMHNSRVQCF